MSIELVTKICIIVGEIRIFPAVVSLQPISPDPHEKYWFPHLKNTRQGMNWFVKEDISNIFQSSSSLACHTTAGGLPPHLSPLITVLGTLGPCATCLLLDLISPSSLWSFLSSLSVPRSPFCRFLSPFSVLLSCYMSCPLAFGFNNFLDDILHPCSWS